ncbi:hypothetical protein [Algoriphagus mannitolivorans]|uniref:hypothetical protein n=1 Tax=Algoriphagus mannitolivorans TaxID=226504 RepID=UPI000407589F|nr:hypothetical protein [Algoriphagus mannitolivorans]
MKINKKLLTLGLAVSLFSLASCSDENEPALGEGEVKVGMGIKLSSGSTAGARLQNTGLNIKTGFVLIKKIELETAGLDANGAEFEREIEIKFPEPKRIDFDAVDSSPDFFFNIPAGRYEEIELEMDVIDYKNQPSLQLEGTFTRTNGSSVPFKFEVYGDDDEDLDFELEIEAEDDDDFFFLGEDKNAIALMQINAQGWFNSITQSQLENAKLTNGVLLINRNVNESIYEKVLEKIESSLEIEIKMK